MPDRLDGQRWLRELGQTLSAGLRSLRVLHRMDPATRIIDQFREAGAVSPQRAQRFHATSVRVEQSFTRLLQRGVLRQARPGRYYLDERTVANAGPVWWSGELD